MKKFLYFFLSLVFMQQAVFAFDLIIDNKTGHEIYVSKALPNPVYFNKIITGKHNYFVPNIPTVIQLTTSNRLGIMIRADITKCSHSGSNPVCVVLQYSTASAEIELK